MEMEALRLQNDALKAENARLKETRLFIWGLFVRRRAENGRSLSVRSFKPRRV